MSNILQELFDKSLDRFFDGKGRCANDIGCVYYREEDGNRCVIGYLLPLETAKEIQNAYKGGLFNIHQIYQYVCDTPPELNVINLPDWVNEENMRFLTELQNVHDWDYNWSNGKIDSIDKLYSIAIRYDLNTTKLDELTK